jgi:hypothetical protein
VAVDPEVGVRFPALRDLMRTSVSGTGSTQLHEYNRGAVGKKNSGCGPEKRDCGRRGPKWRSLSRYSSLTEFLMFMTYIRFNVMYNCQPPPPVGNWSTSRLLFPVGKSRTAWFRPRIYSSMDLHGHLLETSAEL